MKAIFSKLALLIVAAFTMGIGVWQGTQVHAQQRVYMNMLGGARNDTLTLADDGLYVQSGYENGAVDSNANLWVMVQGSCVAPVSLSLTVDAFDIDKSDTVYIYDGPSTSSPLLYKSNNECNALFAGQIIFPSASNTSQKLTIQYKTTKPEDNGKGFVFNFMCRLPCETVIPHIEPVYYKMRDGVVTDTVSMGTAFMVDTTKLPNEFGDTVTVYDTVTFRAVNLCLGESVMLKGYGEYSNTYGQYAPMDATSTFRWNLGNGDTAVGLEVKEVVGTYRDLDCFDVQLSLVDEQGCPSTMMEVVRVRIAQMPIKTIYDLATICNVDSVLVNVGYEGDNGAITLKMIEFAQMRTKTNQVRTFIPDGPHCQDLGLCYDAPVEFKEFPNGRTVGSAKDICSVCVNFEHSFLGDYWMELICPSGKMAQLKRFKRSVGGLYTGMPIENKFDGSAECDSLDNPYGVGFDYCFSEDAAYMLQSGRMADYVGDDDSIDYICYAQVFDNTIDTTVTIPPVLSPFYAAGQTPGEITHKTARPSDHENKLNYYKPDPRVMVENGEDYFAPLSELVGCPLNGTWKIRVCDNYGVDNGWVFNWSLDICGVSAGGGCKYQVGLDSVVWRPDSAYGDFDNLTWRGVVVNNVNAVDAYISSPDTAGTFPLVVSIYDEFGCRWDTTCSITTVWTPEPELGDNITLCSTDSILLNATDAHTPTQNQTYRWEPYGQEDGRIHTATGTSGSTLYTVEVTNEMSLIRCRTRDSIRVNIHPSPSPNIDMGTYPLEGCEPYILNVNNTTVNGYTYHWDFGDGDTSNVRNPQHIYSAGVYDFKYYVTSEGGCKDSLVYKDLITVYPSPKAMFSWEPVNPTVLHPTVTFENRTRPQDDNNDYYWEIQYDKDNPISYHTLTETNPSFTWESNKMNSNGDDISGSYVARLIAKTGTLGPSGVIVECRDTVENTIMLVNDFLQFPNVVTANGDGINDRFEIKNLVEGKGYPNNSLAIYNRWGKRVYFKENISDVNDFWDPAASNMPAGTYFWRFSGKGYLGNIERTGTVEVLVK